MTDTKSEQQITAARVKANETYQRRRARSAVDVLLEVRPELWDEHTRKAVLETLPRLAAPTTSWVAAALDVAFPGGWCDYANETGPCTLTANHKGDHDPDPYAYHDERACAQQNGDCACVPTPSLHDNGHYRA